MKGHGTVMVLTCSFLALALLYPQPVEAGWLEGWAYRVPITLTNSGAPLADHTLNVNLEGPTFPFSHAAPQGADLRLTDSNGTTLLPFWIETWDPVGEEAVLWVRVPLVPAGEKILYAYYGNGSALPAGDGSATFLFYDGFENTPQAMNAPEPLDTPSYDGSGQMVHSDVVYIPEGWGSPNAYAYWMAVTPTRGGTMITRTLPSLPAMTGPSGRCLQG